MLLFYQDLLIIKEDQIQQENFGHQLSLNRFHFSLINDLSVKIQVLPNTIVLKLV